MIFLLAARANRKILSNFRSKKIYLSLTEGYLVGSKEILTKEQTQLLPLVGGFSKDFGEEIMYKKGFKASQEVIKKHWWSLVCHKCESLCHCAKMRGVIYISKFAPS